MTEPTLMIDKAIKQIEYLCRSTGINIRVKEKTPKDSYLSRIIYIINFIWLNIEIAGVVGWIRKSVMENKSITEFTFMAPCALMSTLANIKVYYMVKNENAIDALINKIRKLEMEQMKRMENSETRNIMTTNHEYLIRVLKVLNIFFFAVLVGFALSPVTLMLLNYLQTNEVELQLPFLVVSPFDPYHIRYYPWVYCRQLWAECIVILGICSADFMFYIFCSNIRIQFALLGYYFENIIAKDSKHGEVLRDKEAIRSKLVELVLWHQELRSCVDCLENVYTRSTLFNFVFSSALICLTGFNVMVLDDIAFTLTFLCFLLSNLLEIFYMCYFGDRMMESGMAVADTIYNSKWYLADAGLGKYLLLIQTRSQTPCKLTASKFAVVNLNAFMKICSTAWSYFALLQTLYRGPNE